MNEVQSIKNDYNTLITALEPLQVQVNQVNELYQTELKDFEVAEWTMDKFKSVLPFVFDSSSFDTVASDLNELQSQKSVIGRLFC